MSPLLANILGLTGSAVTVAAYAYSNLTQAINFRIFNLANLIGSLLLITSLAVHFNLAAMVMEIIWAAIAILGLAKTLRARSTEKASS